MNNDLLFPLLIALAVSLIIMYYIIANAVQAGLTNTKAELKIIKRLMSKKLVKQGFTSDEIYQAYMDDDSTHWNRILEMEKHRNSKTTMETI